MALLGELGPLLALLLTVGVSASVALGAHLSHRREGGAFGVYVAYWLFTRDIYHPGNGQICVVWRCTGVTVASTVTVFVGAVVAVLGTGLAGLGLHASATEK